MAESLAEHAFDYTLYIFAFDNLALDVLKKQNIPNVQVMTEDELLDDDLRRIRTERTRAEYCWTCSSIAVSYVMDCLQKDNCTYLDSDIMFFSDPRVVIDELVCVGKSVLITPHFFKSGIKTSLMKNLYGNYCVEFNTFIGDRGKEVLHWWKDQCIEDCYVNSPRGYYGDQKYLDFFIKKFESVCEMKNRGAGMGPWNIGLYELTDKEKMYFKMKNGSEIFRLIFYHYQSMNITEDKVFLGYKQWWGNRVDEHLAGIVYGRYVERVIDVHKRIEQYIQDYDAPKQSDSIVESKRENVNKMGLARRLKIHLLSLVSSPYYFVFHTKEYVDIVKLLQEDG